ncbi:MAG: MFS transporter [Candidatus Hermodarchaeota archaeon]
MTTPETIQTYEDEPSSEVTRKVLSFGVLTLLTITAAAILHVNQPEFILDRFVGITEFEYSLFDSVLYLSYLLFGLLTGALSDRWARRREFVLVGTSGSIVFYWLMTTALTYPLLLIYRFFQGAFTVMAWQTFMTLAIDFSGPYNRGRNMGIFGAFLALAMGMGPAIGGVIASYGVFTPYYAAAVLNAVVLFASFIGLRDPLVTEKRPRLMHSLAVAKRHPKLAIPGLFNFIDRLHIGFILTALPLFLSTVLGLSESLRGLSLAVFALPFIVLQYPMGRLSDRYGRYVPLVVGSIGYGLILSALGYFGAFGFTALLLMLAVLGFFSGVTAPPSMALVGDIVESEDSAMAMGFFNFMGNLGITIGPLIFGFMLLIADFVTAFAVAGLLELLTLALNVVLVKAVFHETII